MALPSYLVRSENGVLLKLFVQPKASRNELAGVQEESLRVRLTAPPIEGEANKLCIKFFSKMLGIPKSGVEILHGHTSRRKVLLIRGVDPEAVQTALEQWMK
jgi:uncharacterized protein (TIGR00251 family)